MSKVKSIVRRKIRWLEGNEAIVDFGYTTDNSHITWRVDLPEEEILKSSDRRRLPQKLYWDGMLAGAYGSEKELKIELIRMAYAISEGVLIPSALLWEAGLRYINTDLWVDRWDESALDGPNETICLIMYSIDNLKTPTERMIKVEGGLPPGKLFANLAEEDSDQLITSPWYTRGYSRKPPAGRKGSARFKSKDGWEKKGNTWTKTYSSTTSSSSRNKSYWTASRFSEKPETPEDDCYIIFDSAESYNNPQPISKKNSLTIGEE